MKHWVRFKKFLLVLFCTVVSLVVLFFICEFAFELKFQWTERQYIKTLQAKICLFFATNMLI